MMRAASACAALLLAACAAAPPGVGVGVAPLQRIVQAAVPDQSDKATLLAALGPTRTLVFDSAYEVWLYRTPPANGRYNEIVILIGPDGKVRKLRRRDAPQAELESNN